MYTRTMGLRILFLWVFLFVIGSGQAAPPEANSQTDPKVAEAKEANKAGLKAYNLGDFPEALKYFKLAYKAVELPEFLFNIAQCQRKLRMWTEAIHSYRRYLAADDTRRLQVQALITECEAAVQSPSAPPATLLTPVPASSSTKMGEGSAIMAVPLETKESSSAQSQPSPAPQSKAVHKKWWFWTTVVGGLVVAGVVVGVAAGVTTQPEDQFPPNPSLGSINLELFERR